MIRGFDKFFTGVVEDRNDPFMLGRVRVRVHGLHPENKFKADNYGMRTDELLWMTIGSGCDSASISGVGKSPTGVVTGTHVYGIFLDDFYQAGLIMGTYAGIYPKMPNFNKGFTDPNQQFPRYVGSDVNILARGGKEIYIKPGQIAQETQIVPATVEDQDLNRDVAIKPNKTPNEDIRPNPNPDITIEDMLRFDEGIKVIVYWDSEDYPSVGIGHLIIKEKIFNMTTINKLLSQQVGRQINDGRITEDECSALFANDLNNVYTQIARSPTVGPVYSMLDDTRKMAIINMTFQLGIGGVANFRKMLAFLALGEYDKAADEGMDSLWATQTPNRARRVTDVIRNGNLVAYGGSQGSVVRSVRRIAKRSVIQTQSSVVKSRAAESNILFQEPASPYAAVYPYNKVFESERGHIHEVDDTPGHERLHTKHRSGTFEEIHPDGTRVQKIIGDNYHIVKNGENVHIGGKLQIVTDGDAVIYVQGDADTTVSGNATQFIRGNSTERVEGNVNQHITGSVTQYVKGDTNSQIDGNLTATVNQNANIKVVGDCFNTIDGNYTLKIGGNFKTEVGGTRNDQVGGSWSRNASEVNDIAQGTFSINGSRINLG